MHTITAQLNDPAHRQELQLARGLVDTRDQLVIWQQQGATIETDGGRLSTEQLNELNLLLSREDDLMERLPGEPEDLLDHDLALRDELSDLTIATVELRQAVEPSWLVEQLGPMPNDEWQREVWVNASEALHEHRAARGIHEHQDPTLPNVPTSLRALLRRARHELGYGNPDAGIGIGS